MKLWMPIALAAAALLVVGCGGTSGKKGGALTVQSQGDVDSLDPGYQYYQYDYMALSQPAERTLYGWKPASRKPSPDFAASMPELADGGKTITIKLRSGVRYSPPVNRAATAADVKYAMERDFLPQVANSYAPVYYGDIVGVKAFTDGKAKDISGIQAPNATTLVIRTTKPVGVLTTANALTLPGTAPVPKEYAQKFDKGKTSTYGQHVVFTGPYMIPNDRSGKITGWTPNKRLELVRNPNWNRSTDYRPAYLDKIVFLGGNDLSVATRKILSGTSQISGDFAAPPVADFKLALERYPSQVSITPGDSYRAIALNTTVKPFGNVNVRKAVAAVINRNVLITTRGGPRIGSVATHYIPTFLPGFQEAGGSKSPYDFMSKPNGDLALAKSYMRKAGYSSGRYSGPSLLMVGDNSPPAKDTGEAVQAQLAELGFKLNYRQVPHEVANSKFCEVPKQKVAICPNWAWGKDFYDSQSMIDPTFNGKNIVPSNNSNLSQLNDPKLNAAMDRAEQIPDPGGRAKAWGAIDKEVTGLAVQVPWIWDNDVNLRSRNVKAVTNVFNGTWDVAFTSIK
jgi:peptide/nickel transport system substrate-binding protein